MAKGRKFFRLRSTPLWLLLLVLVLVGIFLWARRDHQKTPSSTSSSNTAANTPVFINNSPPTSQEKQAAQDNKNALIQNSPTNSTNNAPSSKKPVDVLITSASNSSVKAQVNKIVEDGGTCTASFSQGSITKTFTASGVANVSYTVCPIDVGGLTAGTWTLVVSYSSGTANGSSAPQQVKI